MNGLTFIVLLAVCSVITGIVTQGIKQACKDFPKNILAMIVGIIVGIGTSFVYYQFNEIVYTTNNIIWMIMLAIASGFGAEIGYDKVIQSVKQIQDINNKKEFDNEED